MKQICMIRLYPVLTNGEIEIDIRSSRSDCYLNLPDGVIFGEDNKGHYYLNGKPAHIEHRMERAHTFGE